MREIFKPSSLSTFGADETVTTTEVTSPEEADYDYTEYLSYAEQAAPIVSNLLVGRDDRETLAILKGRLENFKMLKKKTDSNLLKTVYQTQINRLTEQIKALEVQAEEQNFLETSLKGGQVVLIVGGIMGVIVLFQGARYLGALRKKAQGG